MKHDITMVREDMRKQIDKLAGAIGAGGGSSGGSGGSSSGDGIEHMFQRAMNDGESMESIIKKQIQAALSSVPGIGVFDPFATVHTDRGDYFPVNSLSFGIPVQLSREAFRKVIMDAFGKFDIWKTVFELDARDSSSFFSVIFESIAANRKAIALSASGQIVMDVGDAKITITLKADQPRNKDGRKATPVTKLLSEIMPLLKDMYCDFNVSLTPYVKQADGITRARQVYRESRLSYVRNTLIEFKIKEDNLSQCVIVLQGIGGEKRTQDAEKILSLLKQASATAFPIDVSQELVGAVIRTPTNIVKQQRLDASSASTGAQRRPTL